MAGKKRTPPAPQWFNSNAYAGAESLDRGDWLLNLVLRRWLGDSPNPQTERALREVGPLIRRSDGTQILRMHRADCHRWLASFSSSEWDAPDEAVRDATSRPSLPSDVRAALRTGCVPSGIKPLRVDEMYLFERRLPPNVRKAGMTFTQGDMLSLHPPAFGGTLDDAFGPGPQHQMTSRFLRIDLTLPDDVLHADLQHYLATERRRLRELGGVQPYREAARLKLKRHELKTLATIGLLPFLDLDRWQKAEGLLLSANAVREMAGIDKARERELRGRVALVTKQMNLHAWFARLDRSATVTRRRDRG
jgi:hypothetical protein